MSLYLRKADLAGVDGDTVRYPKVTPRKPHGTRPAANDPRSPDRDSRAVDPMLLVYRERVQTFRMLAQMFRRTMVALLTRVSPRPRGVTPRDSPREAGC